MALKAAGLKGYRLTDEFTTILTATDSTTIRSITFSNTSTTKSTAELIFVYGLTEYSICKIVDIEADSPVEWNGHKNLLDGWQLKGKSSEDDVLDLLISFWGAAT